MKIEGDRTAAHPVDCDFPVVKDTILDVDAT